MYNYDMSTFVYAGSDMCIEGPGILHVMMHTHVVDFSEWERRARDRDTREVLCEVW